MKKTDIKLEVVHVRPLEGSSRWPETRCCPKKGQRLREGPLIKIKILQVNLAVATAMNEKVHIIAISEPSKACKTRRNTYMSLDGQAGFVNLKEKIQGYKKGKGFASVELDAYCFFIVYISTNSGVEAYKKFLDKLQDAV